MEALNRRDGVTEAVTSVTLLRPTEIIEEFVLRYPPKKAPPKQARSRGGEAR